MDFDARTGAHHANRSRLGEATQQSNRLREPRGEVCPRRGQAVIPGALLVVPVPRSPGSQAPKLSHIPAALALWPSGDVPCGHGSIGATLPYVLEYALCDRVAHKRGATCRSKSFLLRASLVSHQTESTKTHGGLLLDLDVAWRPIAWLPREPSP